MDDLGSPQSRFENRVRIAFPILLLLLLATSPRSYGDPIPEEPSTVREGVHWGAVPIGNYTSDNGLKVGALAQRFNYGSPGHPPFDSLLTLQLAYATQGPRDFLASWEQTGLTHLDLRGLLQVRYSSSDYQRYYGLGNESIRSSSLDQQGYYFYSYKETAIDALVRKDTGLGFELETGVTLEQTVSEPSRAPSLYEQDFGSARDTSLFPKLVARSIWEKRDNEFIASNGYFGLLSLTYSPGLASASAWTRFDGDYRRYVSLIPSRWLWLAFQGRYTASSGTTPLPDKARLGSLGTLRGLPANRYLSNHSASVRADLRSVLVRMRVFDLPLKGGVGLFTDTGKIGGNPAELWNDRLHTSWGLSLFGSYFTDDFLGSADLGFSEGTQAFYLRLGHAF